VRVHSIHRAAALAAAVLGVTGFGSAATAAGDEPSQRELLEQINRLKAQVERLEATQQQREAPSADEVGRTVESVLTDADRRSEFLQVQGFTAGYDKGFVIQSEDKSFVLRPGIQTQFRWVGNYGDADDANNNEDGFEVRRLRLRFDGNAFSKDLTYQFQWDTNRAGGNVQLLDAWFQYRFAPQWAVRLGQFKESVFHERDVSGFSQLAVERSLNDALLGGANTDRVQGVSLIYGGGEDDALRAEVAYHDGANSRNTDFRDANADFGVGGRAEYKALGQWADYKDFTAKAGKADLLVFGAGADFTQAFTADVLRTTADVQYETAGKLSLYGALHANLSDINDPDDEVAEDSPTDYGALAQVGYLLTDQLEAFGRYGITQLDDAAGDDTFSEITTGVNYYLGEKGNAVHKAKLSLDLTYLPDGSPSAQTSQGALAGEEDQFIVRGQFQLIL
jgi:hypothetical protein